MLLNLILSPNRLNFVAPVSETAKHNAPESSTISYANFVLEILFTEFICYQEAVPVEEQKSSIQCF